MAGVAKQIIGSFEDIGKGIATESIKAVTDVTGKALESLGTPKGKQQKPKNDEEDKKVDKVTARSALEYLASPKPKEPTVYEKNQKELEERNQLIQKQKEEKAKLELKEPTLTPKRGNLLGLTKQKAGSETSKNVRGD